MHARWGIGFALLLALSGCDAMPVRDGAVPDGAARDALGEGGITSTVALPAAPDHGTCPAGWRAVEVEGVHLCDPWSEGGIEDCTAPDEAHFPGDDGCERVGTACGDDGFAPDLPASNVIFVRAGASGGDGSRARPFGTIAAALAVAAPGTTIALSADRFVQDQVDLPEGVTLHGACVSGTVIRSEPADPSSFVGIVRVAQPSAGLRNLRVEGENVGVLVNGGSLEMRDVVVADTVQQGIRVINDGELSATRIVVRDTRPVPVALVAGEGIALSNRGRATITSAVFTRNHVAGVDVADTGSSLTLIDAAVYDTLPSAATGSLGVGIQGNAGAVVDITAVAVDRVSYSGIRALDGGVVTVHLAVVRDVAQARNVTALGAGVSAEEGGSLTADHLWIERATHAAAVTYAARSTLVRSTLVLRDALVRDTQLATMPEPDSGGVGVWALDGADLTLERTVVARSTFAGVLVQESSYATLTDVIVRDTRPRPASGTYGRGLEVALGGTVLLTRALFERNHETTISAFHGGTTIDARDVTVRDALAALDGRSGYGAQVADGASLMLAGADIETVRGSGLLAAGAGTRIVTSDVRIADVRAFDCAMTTCAGASFAYGAAVVDGAALQMSRFVMEDAAGAGLQLATGGEADLSDGMIADTPIAFNVQTAGFDPSRLRAGVTLTRVPVDVDPSALSIAAGLPPFGISLP